MHIRPLKSTSGSARADITRTLKNDLLTRFACTCQSTLFTEGDDTLLFKTSEESATRDMTSFFYPLPFHEFIRGCVEQNAKDSAEFRCSIYVQGLIRDQTPVNCLSVCSFRSSSESHASDRPCTLGRRSMIEDHPIECAVLCLATAFTTTNCSHFVLHCFQVIEKTIPFRGRWVLHPSAWKSGGCGLIFHLQNIRLSSIHVICGALLANGKTCRTLDLAGFPLT
jgi:hypothetical protein